MTQSVPSEYPNIAEFWAKKNIQSTYLLHWFEQHCLHSFGLTANSTQDEIEEAYRDWQAINTAGGECEIWLPPVLVGMVSDYIGMCPLLLIASVILTSLIPSILKRRRIG